MNAKRPGSGDSDDTTAASTALRALISGFDVVGVAFSRVKRSMLATAHARGDGGGGGGSAIRAGHVGEEKGEEEGKGKRAPRWAHRLEGCSVVCVWNAEAVNVRMLG